MAFHLALLQLPRSNEERCRPVSPSRVIVLVCLLDLAVCLSIVPFVRFIVRLFVRRLDLDLDDTSGGHTTLCFYLRRN
jgi:hypothetical protein